MRICTPGQNFRFGFEFRMKIRQSPFAPSHRLRFRIQRATIAATIASEISAVPARVDVLFAFSAPIATSPPYASESPRCTRREPLTLDADALTALFRATGFRRDGDCHRAKGAIPVARSRAVMRNSPSLPFQTASRFPIKTSLHSRRPGGRGRDETRGRGNRAVRGEGRDRFRASCAADWGSVTRYRRISHRSLDDAASAGVRWASVGGRPANSDSGRQDLKELPIVRCARGFGARPLQWARRCSGGKESNVYTPY